MATQSVRGLVALCAILAAVLLPAPARAAEKGLVTDISWMIPDEDMVRTADLMADLGTEWTRINVNWWYIDANPEIGWAEMDRSVELARAAGVKVLLMADHSPLWASGTSVPRNPPSDPQDYADFMGVLAERYADQVDAYEVWNEPNLSWNWSNPDGGRYARLLRASAPAIRAADPGAKVVFGGLGGNASGFVTEAYRAVPDLDRFYDVMGVHPYPIGGTAPAFTQLDSEGLPAGSTFKGYEQVYETVAQLGDPKPIWLTELGWATTTEPTDLGGVSHETQAEYVTEAFEVLADDPTVEVAFWYVLRDHGFADTWVDQLGLMTLDWQPKPAYAAFKAVDPPPPVATPGAGETPAPAALVQPTAGVVPDESAAQRQPTFQLVVRVRRGSRLPRMLISGRTQETSRGRVRLRLRRDGRRRAVRRSVRVGANGRFRATLGVARGTRWAIRARLIVPGSSGAALVERARVAV